MQLTKAESEQLEKTVEDFPQHCYYEYAIGAEMMREYHIDSHNVLEQFIKDDYKNLEATSV